MKRWYKPLPLVAGLSSLPVLLNGAGFALQEQSISGLGTGFASGAVSLHDNSSMYFNAATLTFYKEAQATAGLNLILPEAEFINEGSRSAYVAGVSNGVATQGSNSTSDTAALVPHLAYSQPLGENLVAGISLNVPFGLTTEYDSGWVGRYVALKSELETVSITLSLATKISDKLSIGGGINVLKGDAVLSNAINFGALYLSNLQAGVIPSNAQTLALAGDVQANLGGTKYDGTISLSGDDVGYGFNLGLLYLPTDKTRIGVSYRSKVKLELEGHADFTVGALEPFFGALFSDQGGSVDLELPNKFQRSVYQQINDKFAVMADAQYTWWSKFEKLDIAFEDGLLPNSVVPENWEDVWRFSAGLTYELSEQIQLRGGVVFDESPVPSAIYRSPRIPDEDRVWLSIGMGYQFNEKMRIDVGYVHIIVDDPVIDNSVHTSGEYLVGRMEATVNIFSVGATYQF